MTALHRRWPTPATLIALFVLTVAVVLAACEGCKTPRGADAPSAEAPPSLRLYVLSDLAGALEPCGCVKDQLGGLDHVGALVAARGDGGAAATALVAAGPTFFMDPVLEADRREQDITKAKTIARSLAALHLAAIAPGRNDLAAGAPMLAELAREAGAPLLAAGAQGIDGAVGHVVREYGALKLGIIGVATLSVPDAPPAEGVRFEGEVRERVRSEVAAARAEGAQAVVALVAAGRGEGKRVAEAAPDLVAVVVGSPGGRGEGNTTAPPAERVGEVLVVETANHGQTLAAIDLHARGDSRAFADATGVERIRARERLDGRIKELRTKIVVWEKDPAVSPADLEARRAEVRKLERERAELRDDPPPATGSYLRYVAYDVRADVGSAPPVKEQISQYYRFVNERNRELFKDRVPKPAAKGEPAYVGVESCTTCHDEARAVWDKTPHAKAYATLSEQSKEMNLDCVSCHVTGYDKPGGSTVTHVSKLENVQCEVCHGPGSLHARDPAKVAVPVKKPGPELCASCHHPPHVHEFDAAAKLPLVLGPGHGRPAP